MYGVKENFGLREDSLDGLEEIEVPFNNNEFGSFGSVVLKSLKRVFETVHILILNKTKTNEIVPPIAVDGINEEHGFVESVP
jgi:hypothetical protein